MSTRAVLFDLDGTLVDSLGDVADSLNWALARLGLPTHTETDVRGFIGDGVGKLVERALEAQSMDRRDEVVGLYATRYASHMADRTRPYPGVRDLVDALLARGTAMAVLSNKPDPATRALVAALFPGRPFAAVVGEVPGTPRKPDPTSAIAVAARLGITPARCMFVGDTPVDIATALGAGMVPVGVAWGFRPRAELEAAGARFIVEHPDEILALAHGAAVRGAK